MIDKNPRDFNDYIHLKHEESNKNQDLNSKQSSLIEAPQMKQIN